MPGMDGYEASMRIRQHYQKTLYEQPYIVACTGHIEDQFVQKAWSSRMNELVGKPARVE